MKYFIRGDETTTPNVPALTPEEQARLDAVKAATTPLAEQNAALQAEILKIKAGEQTIRLENEKLGLRAKEVESNSQKLLYGALAIGALFLISKFPGRRGR